MSTSALVVTQEPARLVIPPLWQKLPMLLAGVGGAGSLLGLFFVPKQFAYSYLLAFMFFLSICLGSLFLTLIHHLFDANWTVPLRRVTEHLAFLLPVMGLLFIPIALFSVRDAGHKGGEAMLYEWLTHDP